MNPDAPSYPQSFDEWSIWNEANVRALYRRIDVALGRKREFKQRELAEALDVKEQELSGWKNPKTPWHEIGESRFHRALIWLNHNNLLFDSAPHAVETSDEVYKGAARFFNVTKQGQDLAIKYVAGRYIAYRYSNYLGGEYVLRGFMDIDFVKEDGVLKATELFSVQQELGVHKTYSREGYFFYRDNSSVIASRKRNSNDTQIIFIKTISPSPPHIKDDGVTVENMEGVILDWQENEVYTTRVAFVRLKNQIVPNDNNKAILSGELPPAVRNMLTKTITPVNDYLFRFL